MFCSNFLSVLFCVIFGFCLKNCWLASYCRTPLKSFLVCVCVFKLESTVCAQQRVLQILKNYNPPHPPQVFFLFFFSSANSPHPAKTSACFTLGSAGGKRKKNWCRRFFFHFKRCAKFMMRVQNGNYQAVCLPLAVWFSVVISVCFQFVVEM